MAQRLYFNETVELVNQVLQGSLPADRQIEQYFRDHPRLGQRDRGAIADAVYTILRQRRRLGFLAGDESAAPGVLVKVLFIAERGMSARALQAAGIDRDIEALVARVRTAGPLSLGAETSLPDWLLTRLVAQYGEDETRQLARALNEPATVDLRVNTLITTREALAAELADEGIAVTPTPWSPIGLRCEQWAPLWKTQAFKAGEFEIQDEGSQLLAFLLEPKRREMVVDFCAGAGGKTLAIGALMANTGTLYAFDVHAHRLERFKPRLKRAGLQNVRTSVINNERDDRVRRLDRKIDRVLIDAPCSGTGTLRRNPDIKWRNIDLDGLIATQQRILASAAMLLKPGGRLVYATCSLLKQENEDIVEAFLAAHPDYQLLDIREVLARRNISLPDQGPMLRLLPHRHRTDGFFAAILERRPATGS
jgi:16S rRNA (cytosine967-C5)-methyltransferase